MTNTFLSDLKQVGSVIEWPFVHAARTIDILTTSLRAYPAVRLAVTGLIVQIQAMVGDVAAAAKDKELNLSADEAEVQAAIALYLYAANTFLPAVQSAYDQEVLAATGQAPTTATPSPQAKLAAKKTPPAPITGTVSTYTQPLPNPGPSQTEDGTQPAEAS